MEDGLIIRGGSRLRGLRRIRNRIFADLFFGFGLFVLGVVRDINFYKVCKTDCGMVVDYTKKDSNLFGVGREIYDLRRKRVRELGIGVGICTLFYAGVGAAIGHYQVESLSVVPEVYGALIGAGFGLLGVCVSSRDLTSDSDSKIAELERERDGLVESF